MLRRLVCFSLLALLLYWPAQTEEATALLDGYRHPERETSQALAGYLDLLERRGVDLENQGIRVESLDGGLIYASHHSDRPFNPASVMKMATTLAALDRFGPDHQFDTSFLMNGRIDGQTLIGNLVLSSDGYPEMGTAELSLLAREVIRKGIRRVEGKFIINGPFTIGNLHRQDEVARYVVRTLRRIGIRVPDEVTFHRGQGVQIAQRTSSTLQEILFEQNAHSDNPTADRLGEAIGGTDALEQFLIEKVGFHAQDLRVSRASGLRINRMTAEDTVRMVRKLVQYLDARNMEPSNILPVAGLDQGTTRLRFTSRDYRGAVVAKTGTLVATDDGVSTLAGIVYTEDRGPLLFAIYNTRGPVIQYRQYQDMFIKDLVDEYGGRARINAGTSRASS